MHSQLRAEIPAANCIARPPIPALLSESLVGYSARWLFGNGCVATFGGKKADLIVHSPLGEQQFVEVKATGSGQFQEVKPRDLAADALVWVAFGRRYLDSEGPTVIYVLPKPSRFGPPKTRGGDVKRKFDLTTFLVKACVLSGFSVWRFKDIGSLAAEVVPHKSSTLGIPPHK
jgi:hypothetical protein